MRAPAWQLSGDGRFELDPKKRGHRVWGNSWGGGRDGNRERFPQVTLLWWILASRAPGVGECHLNRYLTVLVSRLVGSEYTMAAWVKLPYFEARGNGGLGG